MAEKKDDLDGIVIPKIEQPQPVDPHSYPPSPDPNYQQRAAKQNKKTLPMIFTIILFFLAIVFAAATVYLYLDIYTSTDSSASGLIALLGFFFLYGFFTYIPAFGLAIAGVCTGASACKSSSKGVKAVGIIFTILNSILLVGLLLLFALAALLGRVNN